jgi:hypothetical protein
MKRLIGLLLGLVAVAGIMSLAYGGSTDSMNIKVTLVSNIEVNIEETEYNFGTLASKVTSVSGTAATVRNTSADNREDWALKLSTTTVAWTLITTGTPAAEEFMLMAQFGTSAPSTWTSANHALSTSNQNCSLTQYFGNNTYGECGLDVIPNATRKLWFRITMPYSSSVITEQTIPVTVTATAG